MAFTYQGQPLTALLMDHNGVLDGASLLSFSEFSEGYRVLEKGEIATGFENGQPSMFLAADTIQKLIFLRSQGVQLWSMSSNVLSHQVELMEAIQRSMPAFKSDVLWNRDEAATVASIHTVAAGDQNAAYCDRTLKIPDSKFKTMTGKDQIRRAYEAVGLLDALQRSSVVVMDDGPTNISTAESEGYSIATFVGKTVADGFAAFFEGLAMASGAMSFQAAFEAHVAANPDLYKVIPLQPASSRISAPAPSRTPVAEPRRASEFSSADRATGSAQGGAFVDDDPAGPATDASSPQALRQSLLSRQNDESGDSACCCVIQ